LKKKGPADVFYTGPGSLGLFRDFVTCMGFMRVLGSTEAKIKLLYEV